VSDRLQQLLTRDGSLLLDVDAQLEASLAPWVLLRGSSGPAADSEVVGRVYVHVAALLGVEVPRVPPSLRLGSVGVWLRPEAGRAVLGATEQDCAGAVDLDALQATVVTGPTSESAPRLRAMLGLAIAMLLGRLGRVLVSAAAVMPPEGGGAWLIVGGDGAGTTTAVLRLVSAGWPFLALERAVLSQEGRDGAVAVDGWPEPAALETEFAGGTRIHSAALQGVLLARQAPHEPTSLRPRPDLDLLGALEQTSPWLRLDQAGASGVSRALRLGLQRPVFDLRLGLDSYADPERLSEVLESLPGAERRLAR
jgi:hypothetical protein